MNVNDDVDLDYDRLNLKYKKHSIAPYQRLKMLVEQSPQNIDEINKYIDLFIEGLKKDIEQNPTPLEKMIKVYTSVKTELNKENIGFKRVIVKSNYYKGGMHRTRRHRNKKRRTHRR